MVDAVVRNQGDSCDAYRCRWPECDCYSAGGPQQCRRQVLNWRLVYAELAANQTPLGAEFEKAYDENVDKLYQP